MIKNTLLSSVSGGVRTIRVAHVAKLSSANTYGGASVERTKEMHLAWMARHFGRPDYMPLTPEDLDALERSGDVLEFAQGAKLFEQGKPALEAFMIQKGSVDLVRNGSTVYRCLCRIGPGSVLGDAPMFMGHNHYATAKALEKVTAFRFDRDRVVQELAKQPRIALRWLVACLEQSHACQRRVMLLMHRTVPEKIAYLLLDEADVGDGVGLTQDEMAQLLGVTRAAINRGIAKLRRSGLIDNRYGNTRIIDRERLARLAG